MKKILVFGGTTEGRIIAETLSQNNLVVHVSVATDYGQQVLEENENLLILKGRLNVSEMEKLIAENNYEAVIDATHPFAKEVSKNIKISTLENEIPLLRFERNVELSDSDNLIFVEDTEDCCNVLSKTTGKILLTTGSKELNVFCKNSLLRERIVARVLPGLESIKLCYENNLEGKQIIAMQGPFSKNMNLAQIEDYDISVLVTKESGKTGGTDSKIQAAIEKGIKCIVIKKPTENENIKNIEKCKDTGNKNNLKNYFEAKTFEQVYDFIEEKLKTKIRLHKKFHDKKLQIDLIGIGMGNEKNLTMEAAEKIRNCQMIFGANRMISEIKTNAQKFPYYLAKDIIPVLEDCLKTPSSIEKICILFSGDTGFFSGATKLQEELKKLQNISVNVIPGISSLSYLASKTGLSYQDAVIISLHGTQESMWQKKLENALSQESKIFILTSGLKDVHTVGKLVSMYNKTAENKYTMATGFELSYENESVKIMNPEESLFLTEEGLYSILLWTE